MRTLQVTNDIKEYIIKEFLKEYPDINDILMVDGNFFDRISYNVKVMYSLKKIQTSTYDCMTLMESVISNYINSIKYSNN